ncbi:MAG: general secretion pathway protein GspN [Rhodanobacter sp.]|jgi:general secretion pathway protein N|nr:general secretion pathway protein GspN [Rhodanobacter sp.]
MNAAHQRRLTPFLVALAALLGALLLLLLTGVGQGLRWAPARQLAPLPPAGNPADLPIPQPLQRFALVWQKPLFSPDRKPFARAADGDSNLGDLELTGIIITPGLRMALLHDKNGHHEVRLREGESLPDGSVTLVELRPRSALFDSSAGRTELKLPAGAPIDPPKGGMKKEGNTQRTPGAAVMQVEAGGMGERKISGGARPGPSRQAVQASRPVPRKDSPVTSLERLRESIQKRRAAHAAAAATH